jgi:sugar lactone lactonase YvrE
VSRFLFVLLTTVLWLVSLVGATDRAGDLEIVAELDVAPGNLTLTPDGLIVMSLHQHFAPEWRVVALEDDNSLEPFPNAAWNEPGAPATERLDSVLGVQSDPRGVVWMLDNGMRSGVVPKLVAWDTRVDALHRVIHLPEPVTRPDSFVNDLAVDRSHEAIYIADPAPGDAAALIVVDVPTGMARRVLEGHESVVAQDVELVIDGAPAVIKRPDGREIKPRVGVNPIVLDVTNQWLYYGPMSGHALYRVRTRDLRDSHLGPNDLAARVERFGTKPVSDGSSMDVAGNIYISDVGANAVGVVDSNGRYRILLQDDVLLSWPDAFSYSADGMLYVVANQLHRGPVLNAGVNKARPPFLVLRFSPLADGVVGR